MGFDGNGWIARRFCPRTSSRGANAGAQNQRANAIYHVTARPHAAQLTALQRDKSRPNDDRKRTCTRPEEVARLWPGDFFGEVALISGEPRNATVLARNAVDTYVLGKTDFEAALATSQSFRDQLYGIYFMRQ